MFGSVIFPKQTEILVDRGDTGNFLNLPYYNEMKGLRYAINDNGAGCTLEEFYQLYDKFSLRSEEVIKFFKCTTGAIIVDSITQSLHFIVVG